MSDKTAVGLLGCGSLGGVIAKEIASGVLSASYTLCGAADMREDAAKRLSAESGCAPCGDVTELLALRPQIVVEAAGGEALRRHACDILRAGADLVALSVGALADDGFRNGVTGLARELGRKVRIVSGAVGGLDLMRAAVLMESCEARVFNRKAPASLNGAPWLGERVLTDSDAGVLFEGSAREAIAGFPRNVNVAVAAALATNGPDGTKVVIRCEPGLEENIHRIELDGPTLRASLEIASKPSASNPKSSVLAAWSVVALLHNLCSPLEFF